MSAAMTPEEIEVCGAHDARVAVRKALLSAGCTCWIEYFPGYASGVGIQSHFGAAKAHLLNSAFPLLPVEGGTR